MQNTSLGRIFTACGVPDWEDIFPKEICGKCYLEPTCNKTKNCAALIVVGGMGAMAAVTPLGAQAFMASLRKTINSVHKG